MQPTDPSPGRPPHHRSLLVPLVAALLVTAPALGAPAAALPTVSPYELPLKWRDDQGATVSLDQYRGQPVLLTMAYSTCRRTCSYALRRLDELQREAAQAGQALQIVVVSYDTVNDGPKSWSDYRSKHDYVHADWHFLTGSDAATRRLAATLDFPYWTMDDHIVHDFKILLIDPQGKVERELTWPNRNESPFATARPACGSVTTEGCKS